jgi:predicted hydrocarbon binding protein
MTEPLERTLPSERLRWLMLAIQRETGSYGLPLLLRQAGLDRYVGRLPAADRRPGVLPEEYARLVQAVRAYYGLGARGTLTRIGREIFRQERRSRPAEALLNRFTLMLLPRARRRIHILRSVAAGMAMPGQGVSVGEDEQGLWLSDRTGDRTLGISSDEPCCWTAAGEIAEALLWAAGLEPRVHEVSCRAAGAEECRFLIRWGLSKLSGEGPT